MKEKISVIVPVYRVAAWLEKCVASLLDQTWPNLEILLIDDGSDDGSGELCDNLAKAATATVTIRVIHQQNKGLSGARNTGIEAATGNLLTFVDSDDYVEPDYCEELYRILRESDADMSIASYQTETEDGTVIPGHSPLKQEVLTGRQALGKLQEYFAVYYTTAWGSLYRKKLFADLRFREGKLHEDEFIIHHLFYAADKIATTDRELYHYVQHTGTIMKELSYRRMDGAEALCERYWFYREHGLDDCAEGMEDIFRVGYFSIRYRITPRTPSEKAAVREIDRYFRKTWLDMKHHKVPVKERLKLSFPNLYSRIRA